MGLSSEFRKHARQLSQKTHCHAGHPFTPSNTRKEVCIRNGKKYVVRICKACEKARQSRKNGNSFGAV